MTAPTRQIDWRPELDAFTPYLVGRCGIVQFKFASEDCAAIHFSTLLKQGFVDQRGNGSRFSIRIDHDFATTHTLFDILEEFKTQLTRVGIGIGDAVLPPSAAILTDNDIAGNMAVSVGSITLNYGAQPGRHSLTQLVDVVRGALNKFIAGNGRFMIEFRDCPIAGQTAFWRNIWIPLLSGFTGRGMVFVHMLGPVCGQTAHEDAPAPDWIRTLPTGFATDEARECGAYDDLIDIFRGEGQADDVASASASALLAPNLDSVSKLHSSLAAVLMRLKAKSRIGT